MAKKTSVLLIYTGGTIGMIEDAKTHQLKPFDFNHLTDQIPELKKLDASLSAISFEHPIDSSNMQPEIWVKLAKLIEKNYLKYDGFVILHGSDTMAFTASALSFMLENLNKPIILTGSQLPIGVTRTDGKENLVTSIEIAAAKKGSKAIITEVCIYFEYKLYRGNRTYKFNAAQFNAFQSPNYPQLAEAGVQLNFNTTALAKPTGRKLKVHTLLNNNIAILKVFPGISKNVVNGVLGSKQLKGVVLETFGSGNASTDKWFIESLRIAIKNGITVLNVSQCNAGKVQQGKYETSAQLKKIGVVSGADMTTEAALTKMMFLLGRKISVLQLKKQLETSLRGELSA